MTSVYAREFFFGFALCYKYGLLTKYEVKIYILLTKHEGRTGRISARGLDSKDRAQRGSYKKDQGPIFSQDGPSKLG